jgi:hypothetical protein
MNLLSSARIYHPMSGRQNRMERRIELTDLTAAVALELNTISISFSLDKPMEYAIGNVEFRAGLVLCGVFFCAYLIELQ